MVDQRRGAREHDRKRGRSFLYWLLTANILFYSSLTIGICFVSNMPVAFAGEPDYIILTNKPNGTELTTVNLPVGGQITAYASAYMSDSYIGLWEVNWTADNPSLGSFNNLTGTSSTYTAGTDPGTVDINGTNELNPNWADNFTVVILDPTVDYIEIRDSPDGLGDIVTSGTYSYSEIDTFYAAGFNNTSSYVEDVEAVWESDYPSVGQVTSPGISTNFEAQLVEVDSTCTVTATYNGSIVNSTGLLSVLAPLTDYVKIRSADNGGGVSLSDPANWPTYLKGSIATYYGAKYNNTVGYFGPVPVTSTWYSNNTDIVQVTSPGNKTTVTCSDMNSGWVWVTLDDQQGHTDQTKVTVLDLTVDYIQIRDAQGGGGNVVSNPSYPVGYGTTFYGAMYNNSLGYIGDVPSGSTWVSTDSGIISVSSPGTSSSITCSNTNWGTVTITLDDSMGHDNTTYVTVLEPTIDYIQIRGAPSGGGNIVNTGTYSVFEGDVFYCAGYNSTAGYVKDVTADWLSDDTEVIQVDPIGIWTNFTANQVATDSTCTITATYNGSISYSTTLLVLAPRVDYIQIRNESGGLGDVVTTAVFYLEGVDSDTYYCAGYNLTVGYIGDLPADWEVTGGIGVVNPETGNSTQFTATNEGDGGISATTPIGGITYSTGTITVNSAEDETPPATPTGLRVYTVSGGGALRLTWDANTDSIVGYNIYRAIANGTVYVKVNSEPVNDTEYVDTGLENGTTYYYHISAVDELDDISSPSPTVHMTVSADSDDDGVIDDTETAQNINNLILYVVIILIIVIVIAAFLISKSKSVEKRIREKVQKEAAELESEIQKMREKGVKTSEIEKILQDTKSQLGETDVQEKN